MVRRVGTVGSAAPHPDPSGGQSPRLAKSSTALHFSIPAPSGFRPRIGVQGRLFAGMTIRKIDGIPRHNRSGVGAFSQQSLMPAAAGAPRYEKPALCLGTASWHGGFCHAPPPPQRGTSPRTTFPIPSPLDSGLRRNDDPGDSWDSEALSKPRNIIFVPMTESVAVVCVFVPMTK